MYEIDGVCYAGTPAQEARIIEAIPLQGGMLLVTFSSGERRLFDTTTISGSAFVPLRDGTAQDSVVVEHGFLSWLDGEIDLAPEYVLEHSVTYNDPPAWLVVG